MCLAIVKPKGVSISEEHLHNGWLNNDHGAGFVCITNEGDFFVHKSLTYEGFIDVYRNAVKDYGDTSDFLIHFRIASKGNVTLDNCHPFIVDEDRVIIHNGTMYNIDIDKKDTRSDTKVFAEDWLSQLPADWEDNEIINLMIEDFIGASKIALLHRTKGVIIYNKDKGVVVDGNWYSNNTYKKYVPMIVHKDDYDMSPWLKGNYYKEHNNKHKSLSDPIISDRRWVICDCCTEYDVYADMKIIGGKTLCTDCYKTSVICDCCGIRYTEEGVDYYYILESTENAVLCDDCARCLEVEKKIVEEEDIEDKVVSVN